MVKLVNFVRLLISLVRLAWRTLCFSWNHGGQLRLLTDELRHVVNDGQLAVHGVTLGTATLIMARANSVEVQRFTDYARVMLETDLVPASLPTLTRAVAAATSEAPRFHALRNEVSPLIDTALPGLALDAATRAVRSAAANYVPITTLLNDAALVDATLATSMSALRIAADNRATITATLTATHNLLELPPTTSAPTLPSSVLTLTAEALQFATTYRNPLSLTLGKFTELLATAPAQGMFVVAQRGADIVWKHSGALLSLMDQGGPALVAMGKSEVMTSYVMYGSAARNTSAVDPELATPAGLDVMNVAGLLRESSVALKHVKQAAIDVAAALQSVKVPSGELEAKDTTFDWTIPGGPTVTFCGAGWRVVTTSFGAFNELASALDDSTNAASATSRLQTAIGHVDSLASQVEAEAINLFKNGLQIYDLGKAL